MKRCATKHVVRGAQTNYKVRDIHAHVIPNIDDGAENFAMSMSLIRMAHRQGVKSIVCTSHNEYDIEKYFNKMRRLQSKINQEHLGIRLYSGCEVFCTYDDMGDILTCLDNNTIPTINNTKYVLVEFAQHVYVSEMIYCLKCLLNNGYIPIVAHVERYYALHNAVQWVSVLRKIGCLFQVNAYSFVDERNEKIKKFAKTLLKEKYISFIGSDAHKTNHRPYAIQSGINYIHRKCDTQYAEDICYRNAERILNIK